MTADGSDKTDTDDNRTHRAPATDHNTFCLAYEITHERGTKRGAFVSPETVRRAIQSAISKTVRSWHTLTLDRDQRRALLDDMYSHRWLRYRRGYTLGAIRRDAAKAAECAILTYGVNK